MMWLPILAAVTSLLGGAVSTAQNISESKKQAKEIAAMNQTKANEMAKKSKELMQRQKTSFLKSGVYFDSGSANAIINESYDTLLQDLSALNQDSMISQKRLIRQGKTAFFNYLANPLGGSGMESLGSIFQQSPKSTPTSTTPNTSSGQIKVSGGIKGDNTTFA